MSVARISISQASANFSASHSVMAIEYGSSPVEQPALQMRSVRGVLPELALLHFRQDFRFERLDTPPDSGRTTSPASAAARAALRTRCSNRGPGPTIRCRSRGPSPPDTRARASRKTARARNRTKSPSDARSACESDRVRISVSRAAVTGMLFHVRRSAPALDCFMRRIADIAVSDALPPALSTAISSVADAGSLAARTANGTAPALRSAARRASPCCRPFRPSASRPAWSAG